VADVLAMTDKELESESHKAAQDRARARDREKAANDEIARRHYEKIVTDKLASMEPGELDEYVKLIQKVQARGVESQETHGDLKSKRG